MSETRTPNAPHLNLHYRKNCSRCFESKPLADFYRNQKGREGLFAYCKACAKSASRKWALLNPEMIKAMAVRSNKKHLHKRRAEARLRYHANKHIKADYKRRRNIERYGITELEFKKMMMAQGGVCAICNGKPKRFRLSIDHCHKSGVVRGLLCSPCNMAIGLFSDSPNRLLAALAYLTSCVNRDLPAERAALTP